MHSWSQSTNSIHITVDTNYCSKAADHNLFSKGYGLSKTSGAIQFIVPTQCCRKKNAIKMNIGIPV